MYSLAKFCYCCIGEDENLKNFSSLSNDNLAILNCTFSAIWTESNNMFICTDCAHNLQKTCDFLNKCRKTCKLLKGYVRQLNQDDSCATKLVDLTVTLSDFRKQMFQLNNICDNPKSSSDSNVKCAENIDSSEFKTLFETDLNCDFLPVNPADIKVELPDSITVNLNSSVYIKEETLEYNFQEETFIDQIPSKSEDQIIKPQPFIDEIPSKLEDEVFKPQPFIDQEPSKLEDEIFKAQPFIDQEPKLEEETKVKSKTVRKNNKQKPFSCCLCCLRFRDRNMLISHLLIHKQSRKIAKKNFYQCSLCNRSYRLKDAFITHYLFHNGYRPYKCCTCEKIFKQRSDLTLHMKTNCQDNNERPHKCTICEKAFKRVAHLNDHKLTHNSLRKYNICDRCGTQFLNKKLLKRHMLHECEEEDEVSVI